MSKKDQKSEPLVNVKREAYQKTRAASGATSLHNGDNVAEALEGMTNDEIFQVAGKLFDEDLGKRYSNLNPGMQRMNIGNRLRGFCRKGDDEQAKFNKAVGPVRKAADKRIKAEEKAKADAKKEREGKAAAKAAAKKKKETRAA